MYAVAGYTNYQTGSWTAPTAGSYTFYVAQKADSTHQGNVVDPIQGPMQVNGSAYTLTVSSPPPQQPTANAATSISSAGFIANWSAVSGATSYRLDVSTSSGFGSYLSGYNNKTVSGTSSSVTGLSAGTTYYYRLRAVNSGGTSSNSNTISVSTSVSAPSAPTAAAASSVGTTSFTANWNSVSGATSYRLDVSTSSGFGSYVSGYNNKTVSGTSSSVTGLSAGTTYYYRVRAVGSGGTSGNSSPITVTTALPAPIATAGTSVTTTSFVANWSTVVGATSYRIDASISSTFATTIPGFSDLDVGNVASRSVTGLAAGTSYYYRVRATNSNAVSGNSNLVQVTTVSADADGDGIPTEIENLLGTSPSDAGTADTSNGTIELKIHNP